MQMGGLLAGAENHVHAWRDRAGLTLLIDVKGLELDNSTCEFAEGGDSM